MTFWERLNSALIENNLTEAELSRKIGISAPAINSWKIRGSLPSADVAVKTAKALNTSVEYLISGENGVKIYTSKNSYFVPLLNQELSAGHGSILQEDDSINALLTLPQHLYREFKDNLAALYVNGDSMEPTLHNGDIVVCDSLGWDNGEGIYAIQLNGKGYVKRVQVQPNKIILKSDNPKYEPIIEPLESDDYRIIGKVRYKFSKVI